MVMKIRNITAPVDSTTVIVTAAVPISFRQSDIFFEVTGSAAMAVILYTAATASIFITGSARSDSMIMIPMRPTAFLSAPHSS